MKKLKIRLIVFITLLELVLSSLFVIISLWYLNSLNLSNDKRIIFIIFGIVGFISSAIISALIINNIFNNKYKKSIKKSKKSQEIKFLEEAKIKNNQKDCESIEELVLNLKAVNEQKTQVESILLHITDGIISFDLDGKVTYINPAAVSFFNLEKEDNTFDKIFKKIGLDVNLEKIIYLDDLASEDQMVLFEEKYINVYFAPFKDSKKIPSGILILLQDITEHVKLDNMRKEFVADVSHELKTPLTSIMSYAETLLVDKYDSETQSNFLNVISSESKRMANLVNDLLTLSKYDNSKNKHEEIEFDLGDLTKKCIENLKLEIEKKKHKVECFVTAEVPMVKADKYGIERVILNILTNSIKYTPEGGNIKIYVGFVYNDAYIKVIDNGIGIPEEDLPRIFERFYRVDKARTRELGGTGLGLSIAKEIMEQNNGSINIKSEFGKGTEVVIRITIKSNQNS